MPVRLADLWLVSNLPQLPPFYLPLQGGIAFLDQRVVTPDPEFQSRVDRDATLGSSRFEAGNRLRQPRGFPVDALSAFTEASARQSYFLDRRM